MDRGVIVQMVGLVGAGKRSAIVFEYNCDGGIRFRVAFAAFVVVRKFAVGGAVGGAVGNIPLIYVRYAIGPRWEYKSAILATSLTVTRGDCTSAVFRRHPIRFHSDIVVHLQAFPHLRNHLVQFGRFFFTGGTDTAL
jgi:hypothetical protein